MVTVIYADILFIINLFIDYICLYIVYKMNSLKVRYFRIISASIIGGVYGVLYLFIDYNVIHIIVYLIISLVAFKMDKKYFSNLFYFGVLSATLGGLTLSLLNIIGNKKYISFCFILSILMTSYLFIFRKRNSHLKNVDLEIIISEKTIKETAFIDSGNVLKDIYTGKNVILIKRDILGESFIIEEQKGFKVLPIEYKNYIIIKCFKPDLIKVIFNNKDIYEIDALIAVDESMGSYCEKNVLMPESLIGDLLWK